MESFLVQIGKKHGVSYFRGRAIHAGKICSFLSIFFATFRAFALLLDFPVLFCRLFEDWRQDTIIIQPW